MKKRRNRICRRIAVALTVALLVGQSHAFVLAEEGVGDTPQTEISSEETETDHPDGEDGQDKCVCGTKCAEDAVNADCPVCAADYAACGGKADDAENNDTENDDTGDSDTENVETENNDLENVGQENTNGSPEENTDEPDQCVCETACTEDAVNADCPVCAADYAACAKNAGEGVNPSVEEVISENVLENAPDEEAGIAALADEGVVAYVTGALIEVVGSTDVYLFRVRDESKREAWVRGIARNDSLTNLEIPSTVTDVNGVAWSVTGVGGFTHCENLESVTIPAGITTIESISFDGCKSLTSVSLPGTVTEIGQRAFCECSQLKEIILPDGVTEISASVLQYCDSLETVILPGKVESIGMAAFFWDKNLTNIELPDSVTSIGEKAFIGCAKMNPVNLKNVTQIGVRAFTGCKSMNRISIPDRLESMGEFAFANCTGWTEDVNGNKNIVIPRSLDKISASTFEGCSGLTEMTIPDSVAGIEDSAFKGCSNLATLNIAVSDTASSIPVTDLAVFEGCPSPRQVVFWNADGTEKLTGASLDRAKLTYLNAPDGDTNDDTWYGWSIDRPTTYEVTIHVYLDDNPWTDHNTTFALREEGDTGFITDLAHVPNGAYSIYDITGVPADALSSVARDTGVDVTVQDGNAKATVNYYTATFYDNDGSGTKAYGEDTPQQQQIVLSGRSVAKPADPTEPMDPDKAGWQFDGWKTADGGSVSYDFSEGIGGKTDIYASWRSADTPVPAYVINASAGAGGSISPSGAVRVNRGGSAIFVITPEAGYRIKSVTVDGVDRTTTLADNPGGGKSYTFTNITQSHTIRVEFEQDGGDNPNPNPDPGGGSGGSGGGGTGDNSNPGDGGGDSSNSGGGNNGGDSKNPGSGNTVNPGNGNNAGNTQTAAGTETSSVQAGGNATGASAGSNAAGVATAGAAVSGVASDTSAQAAGGNGTAASGKEPKTGDTAYWEVYATLAMVAGLTYLLLYVMEESRGMSEREKEAFVAAFIRWGKKGGAFRKCCAMAAIFVLLMYYHTIGKRAGGSTLRERNLKQAF